MGLGDLIEDALSKVGITKERVQRWLGECRCEERKEKLNYLSTWAKSFFSAARPHEKDLEKVMEEWK